jgi:hypothetical protein
VIAALGSTMAPLRDRFLGRARSGSGGCGRFSFLPSGVTSSELWIPKNLFAAAASLQQTLSPEGLPVRDSCGGDFSNAVPAAISPGLVGLEGHAGASLKAFRQDETQGTFPSILLPTVSISSVGAYFLLPARAGWKSW